MISRPLCISSGVGHDVVNKSSAKERIVFASKRLATLLCGPDMCTRNVMNKHVLLSREPRHAWVSEAPFHAGINKHAHNGFAGQATRNGTEERERKKIHSDRVRELVLR
jgi:hypothetical protein